MIEVRGLAGALAGFGAAAKEIEVATHEGQMAGAEKVREAWVANIEADDLILTGRYRDSVHVEVDGEEVKVVSDVPYSPILEHGDSRQAGHYVATRAAEEHNDEVVTAVGEPIERVLR